MIGGSCAMSLWLFPKIVGNARYMGFGYAGMIKPLFDEIISKEVLILLMTQMVGTTGLIWFIGKQLLKIISRDWPATIEATCR
jgi:hypothetical protein